MRPWDKRSFEEANLLNPAFMSIICYQCVKGYCETAGKNAPYVLPFLVTPLVLHKKTREDLPRTVRTAFSTWITQLQGTQAKVGYAQRTHSIVPYVKEALIFSISNKLLKSTSDCSFQLENPNIKIPSKESDLVTVEVVECFKKAYFCGRWFAQAGKIETAMSLLGVKP